MGWWGEARREVIAGRGDWSSRFGLRVRGKWTAQKLRVSHGADGHFLTFFHPSIKQSSRGGIFSQRSDEKVGVEVNHPNNSSRKNCALEFLILNGLQPCRGLFRGERELFRSLCKARKRSADEAGFGSAVSEMIVRKPEHRSGTFADSSDRMRPWSISTGRVT